MYRMPARLSRADRQQLDASLRLLASAPMSIASALFHPARREILTGSTKYLVLNQSKDVAVAFVLQTPCQRDVYTRGSIYGQTAAIRR
jgi:hypothetical protein